MTFWKKSVLAVLALAASFVWYALFSLHPDALTVSVLDVGQGDAIFIETPSGNQILIDGGPGRKIMSELGRVMPAYDKSIDMVLATHTDTDHLSGLVEVMKSYSVGTVIENGWTASTTIYHEWDSQLKAREIPRKIVSAGDRIMLDRDIEFDVLGPTPEDFISPPAGGPKKANEVMIVGRLVYRNNSFLLTGDIGRGDEVRLAYSDANLSSDVLKVSHHGSKYSSTDLLLSRVHPAYAAISVGVYNSYGFPMPEVLNRIGKIGAQVLRTDQHGRITFISDGDHISVE
jgi:competence protein ComEC